MIMIPFVVIIVIFVNPIVNIMLSNAFLPASSILIALIILCFITSMCVPYTCLITGLNKPGLAAKIGGVICITNVILNFAFIPKEGLLTSVGVNGALGAAIATVLSNIIGFVGLKLYAKKLSGINLFNRHIIIHIFAGFTMFLFLFICYDFIDVVRWYYLTFFIILGFLVYLFILVVIKEFNKQDLNFFLNLLHPKEMIKYMNGEINNK